MDEWKYSGRADQMRQIEQDDALKAAGVDLHHMAPGPHSKSSERPLTPEMRRLLRERARRSKMWLLAAIGLLLTVALVSLIGGFGSGVNGPGLALGFVGYAAAVALIGFGIRWLLQADMRSGTYTVEEGWIGTRIQLHESAAPASAGTTREYMLNVGGSERGVPKAVYDAAGTITRGTVAYLGGSILEIRDKDGKVIYHRKGYTPAETV